MPLKNTGDEFGTIVKLFHWCVALAFIGQFALIYWRRYLPDGHDWKVPFIISHKAIGTLLIGGVLLFLLVRRWGQRPSYPANMSHREQWLAKATHHSLFLLMLVMPLTGFFMSQLSGKAISFWGIAKVPVFMPENKAIAGQLFDWHGYAGWAIAGLIAIHIFAALYHHFIREDMVLLRMLPTIRKKRPSNQSHINF